MQRSSASPGYPLYADACCLLKWQLTVVVLDMQVPSTVLYLTVNVWTLTGQCRLHGALIDWFR